MPQSAALDISGARAVIFDLDDTLINWRQAEHNAIGDLVALHFSPTGLHETRVREVYAEVMEENMRSFRATQKWWYIGDRLRLLVQRLDSTLDPELLALSFRDNVHAHLALLPGAMDALHAARRGRRIGMLTNGPSHVQGPKIERMLLAPHFDYVGVTGDIGHWKPSHKAFQHVLEKLGAAAHETIMVGDSIDFDIVPAKQLGMTTVWVDPARQAHPSADIVVATPGELARHLTA